MMSWCGGSKRQREGVRWETERECEYIKDRNRRKREKRKEREWGGMREMMMVV